MGEQQDLEQWRREALLSLANAIHAVTVAETEEQLAVALAAAARLLPRPRIEGLSEVGPHLRAAGPRLERLRRHNSSPPSSPTTEAGQAFRNAASALPVKKP